MRAWPRPWSLNASPALAGTFSAVVQLRPGRAICLSKGRRRCSAPRFSKTNTSEPGEPEASGPKLKPRVWDPRESGKAVQSAGQTETDFPPASAPVPPQAGFLAKAGPRHHATCAGSRGLPVHCNAGLAANWRVTSGLQLTSIARYPQGSDTSRLGTVCFPVFLESHWAGLPGVRS